jgi:hypothetical protein
VLNSLSCGNHPPPQAIFATDFTRPHTVAAAASLSVPTDWQQGTAIGSVLRNFGVFATFRFSSGTPYTKCDPGATDKDVVSGDNCDRNFPEGLNHSRLPTYKTLDMRFTKGFGLGGMDLTAYLDARNILNFRNIIQVFAATNDIRNQEEIDAEFQANQEEYLTEAAASGVTVSDDDAIDLSFGGVADPRTGCGNWVTTDGVPASPNCVYLIRAEERFGNGDHIFDASEQHAASDALYSLIRGVHNFTGAPRRVRLGLELNF